MTPVAKETDHPQIAQPGMVLFGQTIESGRTTRRRGQTAATPTRVPRPLARRSSSSAAVVGVGLSTGAELLETWEIWKNDQTDHWRLSQFILSRLATGSVLTSGSSVS
ncbi:hypothetical protein PDE_07987 [Penicillium oxalicum 114-2]|uniref:Uncharacterized protein n=1 Tax=Penicillium oxalicum (strain 114-2 / CGMCC 5302) TaxID=933388 RepID=S7ZW84_PENO1|nr:hypothetical protein PDE_07987 [Penicillium oxalicum 114-2]